MLSDVDVFASDWRRAGHEAPPTAALSMQELDPPDHTPVRRLFTTALRDQDLDAIAAFAVRDTAAVFEQLADTPSFDFTAEVARPVALQAVCRLLGVEPPPVAAFAELSDALVRGMDAGLLPEVLEPAMAARGRINALMAEWFTAHRRPGLLTQVLHGAGAAGAAGVTEDAVWNNVRVLFLAGFSTTVGAAANAVLALLEHPGALERLRDPALLDSGVEELLRYDGPVQGTTRACVETTEIDGVTVERGQLVLALFGAANRDPERFACPDELLLDRHPNRHLSLGWGPHACSGALLARIIIRALVQELLAAPAPPRLAAPPVRVPRATLRYPDRLPVTFQNAEPER
ncbi:cytochrome P450 [Streptomyces sp. RPA4-5]|uniref:cytochrome P450 n=1 Tax=Streptomyces sp. RPA4-5 TaxID=2721245 RepID=UPI00143E5ECE|nr:cytochrome P450 [Streptomyces sp. RPA4-5]QIY58886.1 cytochrome P450 [Streptomyces sp. RPA4-5]